MEHKWRVLQATQSTSNIQAGRLEHITTNFYTGFTKAGFNKTRDFLGPNREIRKILRHSAETNALETKKIVAPSRLE